MLWRNGHFCVVKIGEVAGADVDGRDTEADLTGVDTIEVDEPFERGLERARIVQADRVLKNQSAGGRGAKKPDCPNISALNALAR